MHKKEGYKMKNKIVLNKILEDLVYRYFNNEDLETLIKEAKEILHKEK